MKTIESANFILWLENMLISYLNKAISLSMTINIQIKINIGLHISDGRFQAYIVPPQDLLWLFQTRYISYDCDPTNSDMSSIKISKYSLFNRRRSL